MDIETSTPVGYRGDAANLSIKEKIMNTLTSVGRICSLYRKIVISVVVLVFIWWISKNRFLRVREAYVHSHWVISPIIQKVLGLDLSEHHLYSNILPNHGYKLPRKKGGCIWDVGANNGVWFSNSHYLIHEREFKGYLYEPDAGNFLKLRDIYQHDEKTSLFNFGLGTSNQILPLRVFPLGLENTIVSSKRNQFDGLAYHYSIGIVDADILCQQLREALKQGLCNIHCSGDNCKTPASRWHGKSNDESVGLQTFTVLSVDIEGAGADVVRAAHRKCGDIGWDLLILETPPGYDEMKKMGYEWMFKDRFNDIYRRSEM